MRLTLIVILLGVQSLAYAKGPARDSKPVDVHAYVHLGVAGAFGDSASTAHGFDQHGFEFQHLGLSLDHEFNQHLGLSSELHVSEDGVALDEAFGGLTKL